MEEEEEPPAPLGVAPPAGEGSRQDGPWSRHRLVRAEVAPAGNARGARPQLALASTVFLSLHGEKYLFQEL